MVPLPAKSGADGAGAPGTAPGEHGFIDPSVVEEIKNGAVELRGEVLDQLSQT